MNLSKVFGIIFGAIIFFLIVYVVGIEKIIQSFKDFNFIYLPLILFILFILYILAGINTWIIAKAFGKVSLGYVIKTTFITLVYAVIIPGKLADLLMIPFLKKQGLNLSQSTITIGLDKIISLVIKSVFGLFGAIFILKKFDLLFFGLPLISICLIFILRGLQRFYL